MAEYIDRALAQSHIDKDLYTNESTKAAMKYLIRKVPAADVAPVVHGRWVQGQTMEFHKHYSCSGCGRQITIFVEGKQSLKDYPYCHCGAKMDGGDSSGQ